MIKFFRRIRFDLMEKNKTGKYLKYAIGEIVLVVIGILIALQINNWNEARKKNQKEAILIKNIVEDLYIDAAYIDQALGELDEQLRVVDQLIARVTEGNTIQDYTSMGLVRYSSDFRPKTQRNHTEAVSNLEKDATRKLLQNYFIKEDQVNDIFLEYEAIIHNEIRPYLRASGMHNLNSLYTRGNSLQIDRMLHPQILEAQLQEVKFQQLLYERRLKTASFKRLLQELKDNNQELVKILNSANK
jgi:hypothetical protein